MEEQRGSVDPSWTKIRKTKETEWIKDNSGSKIRNVQFFHIWST